jgi:hypothetical protein
MKPFDAAYADWKVPVTYRAIEIRQSVSPAAIRQAN